MSVCFRMMDVETANSTAAKGGSGLPRIFAAASTFVSCLALAGVFVLVLQNQKLQSQMDGLQQAPQSADSRQNDAQKEIARREVSVKILPVVPLCTDNSRVFLFRCMYFLFRCIVSQAESVSCAACRTFLLLPCACILSIGP